MFNRQQIVQQQSEMIRIDSRLSSILSGLAVEHFKLEKIVHPSTEHVDEQDAIDTFARVDSLLEQIDNPENRIIFHPNIDAELIEYQVAWARFKQVFGQSTAQISEKEHMQVLTQSLQDMVTLFIDISHASLSDTASHVNTLENALHYLNEILIGIYITFILIALFIGISFLQFRNERREAEKAMQTSEHRLRALLEAIPDAVIRRNRAGYYTDFKPAKGFGRFMPSGDFLGRHISEILPPEVSRLSIAASEQALATGEEQTYEYRLVQRQTQQLRDYEARVLPSGADEVQVVIRDVTEEKMRAGQIQQAQKMESLGVLAGGIAHDFNNLLTGMMAQISLAKSKLELGVPAIDQLDKAARAAQTAADLVSQLLAYTGKGQLQVKAIDLNQLIQNTYGLIEAALPNRAHLKLNLDDNLPYMEADSGQIQQVIMNLIINAAEALYETGGQIEVITSSQLLTGESDPHRYFGSKLLPGQHVVLQVLDNGRGIAPSDLPRIFEPFFSTKRQGHGLGLAACLGIIRTHHGAICVESEVGVGTTMTLLFPAKERPADEIIVSVKESKPEGTELPQTTDCQYILVIDDELAIRDAVSDIFILENVPYLMATSGEEGVELFRQQHAQICLVLLDMKMAGMGGKETFHVLQQIEPQVRVILSSGFSEIEISNEFQEDNIVAFLQKPYSALKLMQFVRAALKHHDG